ncbi:hypothetical protein ES702_01444 [subsurface metagenome]
MSKFRYGKRGFLRIRLSWLLHHLKYLKYYIMSLKIHPELSLYSIDCIMCVWDEYENIDLAIKSAINFVDRFIIIDKNGKCERIVNFFKDKTNIEYYIKPELNLTESRLYAISKSKANWILILDGDEVLNNVDKLRGYMNHKHIILRTRMNRLVGKYNLTEPLQNSYHNFLYHNNNTFFIKKGNIPLLKGRGVFLKDIFKFNLNVKNPLRMYIRLYHWDTYDKYVDHVKYPSIEQWLIDDMGLRPTQYYLDEWYKEFIDGLIPYDENILGKIPKVIKDNRDFDLIKIPPN